MQRRRKVSFSSLICAIRAILFMMDIAKKRLSSDDVLRGQNELFSDAAPFHRLLTVYETSPT